MLRYCIALLLIPLAWRAIVAQEQPQIQQKGIWLENVQIDGVLDEWPQPHAAYNEEAALHYSIANDDTYLYLAIVSNRTARIYRGGVNFVLHRPGKPDLEVIYPYNLTYDWTTKEGGLINNHPDRPRSLADFIQMETRGLTGGVDSILFTTNAYGIFAAITEESIPTSVFEEGERHYIVEMAIPLAHVLDPGTNAAPPVELDYSIRLRGIKINFPVPPLDEQGILQGSFTSDQWRHEKIKARDQWIPATLSGRYALASKETAP